jgi:thioredoxin reductase
MLCSLLELRDKIALDSMAEPRHLLLDRLREKRVDVIVRAKVKEILDDGVVFERDGQEETLNGFEYVVLAMGAKSVDTLSKEIEGKVPEVYVIGDATYPRRALEATAGGAEIGRQI